MKKAPLISIITPVYNEPKICRSLNSVINQSNKQDIEIIVVDGGSKDETLECLEKFKDDIDVLIQENDSGIYDAMNKGIKAATGDIIGILNSDDFYPNSKVLSKVAKVFKESNCDCLYGDLVYVDQGNAQKIVRYWQSGSFKKSK